MTVDDKEEYPGRTFIVAIFFLCTTILALDGFRAFVAVDHPPSVRCVNVPGAK